MRILTIGVPLGKAQKRTYVTPAPGAALRLPRVVDATCRRQTQNTVPLRTMCISLSIIIHYYYDNFVIAAFSLGLQGKPLG